jgi:hypothetical protein
LLILVKKKAFSQRSSSFLLDFFERDKYNKLTDSRLIMKINIKGKDVELHYSFRALMIYEEILGESFTEPKSFKEIMIFFYSIVLASTKEKDILFDDFVDWLDSSPDVFKKFVDWLKQVFEQQAFLMKGRNEKIAKKAKKILDSSEGDSEKND